VTADRAVALLESEFGLEPSGTAPDLHVAVPLDRWREVAGFARATLGCGFFSFSTAIDWKDEGLDVLARVENLDTPFALTLRTRLPAGTTRCPSLVPVYRGAEWMERECFDMFGVVFDDHPDLRRILLPEDWEGHPLLKSYDFDTPHPPYR